MKRIAWLTDIHLNFLPAADVDEFLLEVRATGADAVLIGGDIAEAHDLLDYLERLDERLPMPVYFVLGNHDYYFGSIAAVRDQVTRFCSNRPNLRFLTTGRVEELSSSVGLVGHDGWADARLGDYERSVVSMHDYALIDDLKGLSKETRWPRLKALGDEAAAHFRRVLPQSLARYKEVFLLTHVPPLREACWHEGQLSDDQWSPHFTCQAVGAALLEIMRAHPDRRLTVLCGHTHGSGECQPLANLRILTGGARYSEPQIQQIFELE